MPKEWFITPEGGKIEILEALVNGALADRYPQPYLEMCASERVWTGKPSTTQLINGTRLEYLKLTTPYAVDPDKMAFAVLGTKAHKTLEAFETKFLFVEEKGSRDDVTGILDLLEQKPNGEWWLEDYKTWGSFRVKRSLGYVSKKYDEPILDDEGNPVLLKSGPRKGQVKTKVLTQHFIDPRLADLHDVSLQLNNYRMWAEQALQERIARMKAFITVRDGGLWNTKNQGIENNTYYLDIPRMDDDWVKRYFEVKKAALLHAMDTLEIPERCSEKECWDGNRCKGGWCEVAEACFELGDNPHSGRTAVEEEAIA